MVGMTGCQKEAAVQEEQVQQETEQVQQEEEQAQQKVEQAQQTENVADTKKSYIFTCSLCEIEKICGTYTAEGEEYIVCHDCANEFITAFAETADKQICSGCQEEKICATYVVDGQEYIVCPDDFEEFAYGMKLNEE